MPDLQTCIPTDFTFQQIECIVLNVGTDNASPQMKVVYRDFWGGFSPRSKKDLRKIISHYFVFTLMSSFWGIVRMLYPQGAVVVSL